MSQCDLAALISGILDMRQPIFCLQTLKKEKLQADSPWTYFFFGPHDAFLENIEAIFKNLENVYQDLDFSVLLKNWKLCSFRWDPCSSGNIAFSCQP